MRQHALSLYIALTIVGAIVTIGAGIWLAPHQVEWHWWQALLLLVLAVAAERLAVPLPVAGYVSVATIAYTAGALLLPPPVAAGVFGVSMLIVQLWERVPISRLLFNTSCTTMTVGLTALLANHLRLSGSELGTGDWTEILRFFIVAVASYAINLLFTSGVIALASGSRFWTILRSHTLYSAAAEFACAIIGGVIALVWVRSPNWTVAAFFPALIAQLTLQYIAASARKASELEHQARHDLLTDLPNRTLLGLRVDQAIEAARQSRTSFALLMLDLDRFKDVNDTFGHHLGDLLLQEVARRLPTAAETPGQIVARLGGDEFALLAPGLDADEAVALAARVIQTLEQPFTIEDHAFDISGSIGIALYPEHGQQREDLLRRADVAMYVAKRAGLGHAIYDPEQDPNSRRRIALIANLRQAIEQEEITLHFQPKVSLPDGVVRGVEALARWSHPRHGLVPPDQFIPLAEQTAMIRPLSRLILSSAMRHCHEWRALGLDMPVAVNLSMRDLQNPELPAIVEELLGQWELPAHLVRVELTESTLMDDPQRSMLTVTRLREIGLHVSIDDFGTGYSSLAYLKRLPVDELKIDHSFVRHMATSESDATIVRSTIGLAHELGLTVVTEGVEDYVTWQMLLEFSADSAQGFFVSRPLPAAEFITWLRRGASGNAIWRPPAAPVLPTPLPLDPVHPSATPPGWRHQTA